MYNKVISLNYACGTYPENTNYKNPRTKQNTEVVFVCSPGSNPLLFCLLKVAKMLNSFFEKSKYQKLNSKIS